MEPGRLELRLLGPPAARRDGAPLRLRTRKALALLAYLAAEGGTHRRAELAALLWPESGEKRARTTLRSALADLRGALGSGDGTGGGLLLVDRESLGLGAGAGVDLDLNVLRTAHELARYPTGIARPDGGERRELVGRLREGSEAYRGGFMEGFYLDDAPEFDHWASVERERWRTRLAVVLDALSGLLLERGEAREAAAIAERWTAHEPHGEAAHGRLMRTRYALGDTAGALRVYEQYRSAAEGGPEMAALAARIEAERGDGGTLPRPPLDRRPGQAYGLRGSREAPDAPLVGRSEELAALAEEHGLVPSGGVRAVAIVGEAGIGKTRLAEEFLLFSAAEGADVLRGYYSEVGEGVPYGGVISVLRPRLERERAPDDLLDDVWLSELGRILPELGERYPDLPPPTADEAAAGSRLFEAVVRLFEALARRRQVTLFMDDLHWADAAALNRLRYVVRRLAEDGFPVLVVLAMREEEMDWEVDLWGWLSSLERVMPVRRLELGSLNADDTLQVLRSMIGGEREDPARELEEFGRRLHAETGGQPFFLLETIRALLDRGTLHANSGAGAGATAGTIEYAEEELAGLLPPGVRGLIRERLSRLAPAASDLLAAGAVLGDGFEFEIVRRVAGRGEGEALSALDEALRGRVLRESRHWRGGEHGGYSFVHDKIRDVVYTDAGEARRRVFHRRALETLEAEGAPAAELARHALAARANEAAFRHSVAAAVEALAVFAVEDARTHFGRARSLLEGEGVSRGKTSQLGTPEERIRLYAGLGRVHEVTREWGEARDVYERMLEEARRAGDREAEWSTLHRLATLGIEANAGQSWQEDEFYQGVLRKRNDGDKGDDERGHRSPGDATPEDFAWSFSTARVCATEALGLAREMRREDLVAQSLATLGVLEAYSGRWERSLSAAEEGLSFHSRMGDRTMEGRMLNFSAWGLLMTGEPGEAIRRMRDYPGLTGELGDREIHRATVNGMVLALIETGDYEEALHVAREGLAAARSVGYAPRLMLNLLVLGDALRALFRLREAGEIYREMAGVVFPPEYRALVHSKLCAVAALAADWTEAHAEALLAARLRDEAPVQSTGALHIHLDIAALLHGGDGNVAREQLERFGEAVGENRRLRLAYLRALAVLRKWEGDSAAALEHLQEARELAEEIGLPGELWQIEASLGELHEELGDRDEAHRSYPRAAEIVRRLAGGIQNRELRQRFLSATLVQSVLDAD